MNFRTFSRFPRRCCDRLRASVFRFLRRHAWKHPRLASYYYAIFSADFAREQTAFLAGVHAYEESLNAPSGTSALIRRNVHRLEKGLLMRPRRIPFATDYIGQTVEAFVRAQDGVGVDTSERNWAIDVLQEYFRVHEEEQVVEKWKNLFMRANAEVASCIERPSQTPYLRDLSVSCGVTSAQLLTLAQRRRSVRWFLPKAVDREIIDRAVEIGTLAPSACNRQPFTFRIFDDASMVQKIIAIPFGLSGYGHNVPVVVVVVGEQRHYFDARDRHLIYIDASLAVMGFLFGLESEGLGSCCVNWPDIAEKEEKLAHLLELAPDERPIMLIAIGHPDPEGMVACSTKKSLSRIRRYNFE